MAIYKEGWLSRKPKMQQQTSGMQRDQAALWGVDQGVVQMCSRRAAQGCIQAVRRDDPQAGFPQKCRSNGWMGCSAVGAIVSLSRSTLFFFSALYSLAKALHFFAFDQGQRCLFVPLIEIEHAMASKK